MSSEAQPINPARFAEALKDLPASSLALKVLELRNSIAHLDYSNAELKPFAEGTASAVGGSSSDAQQLQQAAQAATGAAPDQDCIDAIAENEAVIGRMQERIQLIRVEVENRGLDWREFQGKPDDDDDAAAGAEAAEAGNGATTTTSGESAATTTAAAGNLSNGVNGHGATSNGTDDGETQQHQQHEAWRDGTFQAGTIRGMSDEELLRQLMERMPNDNNDDDDAEGGMHL